MFFSLLDKAKILKIVTTHIIIEYLINFRRMSKMMPNSNDDRKSVKKKVQESKQESLQFYNSKIFLGLIKFLVVYL